VLTRLIYVNLAVFVAVKLIQVLVFLFSTGQPGTFFILDWLAVPANMSELLYRPWTIFTYMFLHEGFLHILFNILWLYWFGRIFLEYLDEKKLLGVYIWVASRERRYTSSRSTFSLPSSRCYRYHVHWGHQPQCLQ
jgi:membrane associated rhomboid family serine protease